LANHTLTRAFKAAFAGKSVDELMNNYEARKRLAGMLDRLGYSTLATSLLTQPFGRPNGGNNCPST
jgi:hypothetical protein